ncbi:UNVERIFIED_CONTAM: Histone-lysine N-methyltransferase ATXR3 [Sesamum latifolium]|uniref:Histone-lysine N-methyltransferase ATXR3 n=1 Tax=Sesamum latifolium TaxID=2727402 RepID=A0AAW2WTT5_9LAMI
MGDGGVACVPSQHIMEKFSICGGKTNGNTKLSSSSNSSTRLAKVSPNMKPKKDKGSELGSKDFGSLNKEVAGRNSNGDASNDNNKEEVEEGELGTLPFENGEFVLEKPVRRYEIKSEIEKGEFVPGKWRKGCVEVEKNDWRSSKDELEKGEFVPDRWCRSDAAHRTHEYGYSKSRRYDIPKEKRRKSEREWTSPSAKERGWKGDRDTEPAPLSGRGKGWKADREWSPSGKEKGWRGDREREWTPPSTGKYSSEKELARSVGSSQHLRKFSSRYETEKTQKTSSKLVADEGSLKNEVTNSKSHAREHSFSNRLKRPGNDSNSGDRKFRVDYDEYSSSKNRKISNGGSRSGFSSDHYSGRTTDRQYKLLLLHHGALLLKGTLLNIWSHLEEFMTGITAVHIILSGPPATGPSTMITGSQPVPPYQSPSYVERSPRDHDQNSDIRDRTPTSLERSPHDRGRYCDHLETNRKAGVGEKPPSHHARKGQEGKINLMTEPGGSEAQFSAKESPDTGNLNNKNVSTEKTANDLCHHEELSLSPALKNIASSQENGVPEEPASMEEDMDICNTPPHAPLVENAVAGKWYYLDHFGIERGPSKLSDLKTLLKEGYLVSDHLIRHLDSDRWVTVEKAVSPLVTANFHSIVPDTVTQLVCPPEAPGNLLGDNGNGISGNEEILGPSAHPIFCPKENSAASEPEEDLRIDDRVGALLEDITLIPGKEVEMLAEVLQITSEHGECEKWGRMEGYTRHEQDTDEHLEERGVESWQSGSELKDIAESRPSLIASSEKDNALTCSDTGESFSGEWVCRGCDWKRNDEATQDRTWKRKLVLNDGYPLCQMPKSGCEDPRWEQKDELYYPSQSKRLDLPLWAFTSTDELNDSSGMSRSGQTRAAFVRGVRGMMLPVIRINACVVKDHGSFVSEPRVKVRGKERFSSRSSRPHSATVDTKRSSEDVQSKGAHEEGSQDSRKKSAYFSIPRDRICKVEELKLHLGEWYFLDGAGHERGPLSFSELQVMADQGVIQKDSSVFRKRDKIWVQLRFPVSRLEILTMRTMQLPVIKQVVLYRAKCRESPVVSMAYTTVYWIYSGKASRIGNEVIQESGICCCYK